MEKRLIVDADSCPVKNEIIQIGKEFSISAIFVASYAHYMNEADNINIIYVDPSNQSVDLFIANYIKQGDVVITGDYGLASIVLKPGIKALTFMGREYTKENIDIFLSQRHYTLKAKRSGGKIKGPKAFTNIDRKKFVESLRKILNS